MADTYGPIEAVHKTTYQANVELAIQQKLPKLLPHTSPINDLKGKEMQAVELVGSSEAQEDAPHSTDTPDIPPRHLGIYVKPRRIIWGRSIPSETSIKAAVDYQSTYVQEGAAAVVRSRDKFLSEAAFGPRYIKYEEDGIPVSVAFDTTNRQIAVNYGAGSDTGLTVKKIVRGLTLLEAAEVDIDSEELILWHSAAQNESLYAELQVTSKDYRDKAVFEDKRVREFMGIKLVSYQKLPVASSVRTCLLYCKSGLHSGDAMPVTTQIERNVAKQYQPHPFMETWLGSTRSEDEKFVQILAKE